MPQNLNPTQTAAWQHLKQLRQHATQTDLKSRFAEDSSRAQKFTFRAAGLTVDLSKNFIDREILSGLEALSQAMGLEASITDLFAGREINRTEARPALHTKLRDLDSSNTPKDPKVASVFQRLCHTADVIGSQQWKGHTGATILDVVNIGIGGSDLGPRMACSALEPFRQGNVNCHFISNCDPSDIAQTLELLNPETTLFIVSSKSFTTYETLTNAITARDWLLKSLKNEKAIANHFLAVTAKPEKAVDFGIDEDNIFPMWDWVGGRFSLWSAIGLPIAVYIGSKAFADLLAGAQEMDQHFLNTPVSSNIPALMGLLDLWYVNFWDAASIACLPYDHHLQLFPSFLQQLIMESNGKSTDNSGAPIHYATCPAIWGGVGSNGQHSFHQLLHQGTHLIPCDFILPLSSHNPIADQHTSLVANGLSQSLALMKGKTLPEAKAELRLQGFPNETIEALAPHKVIPGNRPSSLIMYNKTSPDTLGALIALYEHRVYTASVIWNINAFDQWGVELGKTLSNQLQPLLTNDLPDNNKLDSSTAAAIKLFRNSQ